MEKTPSTKRPATSEANTDSTSEPEPLARVTKLLPSAIFPKSDRPDWLMEDAVIDSFSAAEVGQFVSTWRRTRAMERQNEMKEEKVTKTKGGLKVDQTVNVIQVKEGEDDAVSKLHEQRFLL